jgi:hypothetical protein
VPVFFDAKVFPLHADHNVDRMLESLRTAESPFFRLVTDNKNDAVSDRFAKRSDLMRIRRRKRVPRVKDVDGRSDRAEVGDRVAKRAALRRIDAPRINVGDGANIAIHFFDLPFADRNSGAMNRSNT